MSGITPGRNYGPPGEGGNHGCTESFIVEGQLRRLDGNEVEVQGTILEVHPCDFCGTPDQVGDAVRWRGWIDPDYYDHEGVQL